MQHVLCDQLPSILFRDHNGYWRPLNHLYWSQSSQVLVARHPNSTVEEAVSHYCPQCLTRYSDEEAKQYANRCSSCMQCPYCESPTSTIGNYLVCGMCMWTSSEKHLLQSNSETYNATDIAKSAFQILLRNFNESDIASNPNIRNYDKLFTKSKKADQMEDNYEETSDAGKKNYTPKDSFCLKSCEYQPASTLSSAQISADFQAVRSAQRLLDPSVPSTCEDKELPPFRTALQIKRTVRSRSDLEAGRMNILMQSKSFPLEGDSSLKIQRGKWWPKDSSAVLQLPSFFVRRLPDVHSLLRGRYIELILCISNPKEAEMSVRFLPAQKKRLSIGCRLSSGSSSTGGGGVLSTATAAIGDQEDDEDFEDVETISNKGAKATAIDTELPHGDWDDAEGVERRYLESDGCQGRWLGANPVTIRLSAPPLPASGLSITLSGFEDELLRDEDDDEGDDDDDDEVDDVHGGMGLGMDAPLSSQPHFSQQLTWRASQRRHSALIRVPIKLSERQREKVERMDRSREGSGQLLFELRLLTEVVSEKKINTSLPVRVFFTLFKDPPQSN